MQGSRKKLRAQLATPPEHELDGKGRRRSSKASLGIASGSRGRDGLIGSRCCEDASPAQEAAMEVSRVHALHGFPSRTIVGPRPSMRPFTPKNNIFQNSPHSNWRTGCARASARIDRGASVEQSGDGAWPLPVKPAVLQPPPHCTPQCTFQQRRPATGHAASDPESAVARARSSSSAGASDAAAVPQEEARDHLARAGTQETQVKLSRSWPQGRKVCARE